MGGHLQRNAVRCFDDQCEPTGPERFRETQKVPWRMLDGGALERALAHQHQRLVERIYQDRKRPRLGTPLDSIQFVYCGEIERIGGQSVERIRGNPDHTAPEEKMCCVAQHICFRGLRTNAQQFCGQLFGLWRSRNIHPAALRPAAIIWATLPYTRKPAQWSGKTRQKGFLRGATPPGVP